jgi:hypothetical protein
MPPTIERIAPRPRRTVESIAREEASRIVRRELPEIPTLADVLYAGYGKPGNELTLATNPGTGTFNNIVTLGGSTSVLPGGDILLRIQGTLVWAMTAAPPSTSELTIVLDPVIDDTVLLLDPDRSTFSIAPAPKKGAFPIYHERLLMSRDLSSPSLLRGGNHKVTFRIRLTAIDMGNGTIKFSNASMSINEVGNNDRVKLFATG